MELAELKQKRKEFLEDTWKYYDEDVSRRAIELKIATVDPIDPTKDNKLKSICKYKTSDGKKCAIGRYIPDDKYDPSIEGKGIGQEGVSNILPKEIMDLGDEFLVKIQLLHDCDDNWNEYGLSGQGESQVADIEDLFVNIS